jgi:signal transduction histidine kinase
MPAHGEMGSNRPHTSRLAALGAMASGIAHEINTPIQFIGDNLRFISDSVAAIGGLLEHYGRLRDRALAEGLLTAEIGAVARAEEAAELDFLQDELPGAIEQSLAGIQQVARIALAMKAFAHPGGAGKELADVNQAIEMTATISRNEWKYHADLDLALDPDLPKVCCHVGELGQVWLNLIVNAAQAIKARPGPERGRIRIGSRALDGMVEITVADNGGGVPDAIRERIFEPFFSTKEAGEGSGQGLAICREIVVGQHGGSIALSSAPGEGACFAVRLPIHAAAGDLPRAEEVVA